MSYKLGFLKLRFTVEKGSKKEKIIKFIIKIENNMKLLAVKILNVFNIKRTVNTAIVADMKISFCDTIFSYQHEEIINILNKDIYSLNEIDFKPNDIIIDIGGNIGMVSIFLAKKYPFLKIYSFEPCKETYISFVKNIKLNNIPDNVIFVYNKAVTKDARNVIMDFNYLGNEGSKIATNQQNKQSKNMVESITLDSIIYMVLSENKACDIKLLKMDCEFSEYEILYNTKVENLKKIDCFRGEFHENGSLKYNAEELKKYISCYIKNIKVEINKNC